MYEVDTIPGRKNERKICTINVTLVKLPPSVPLVQGRKLVRRRGHVLRVALLQVQDPENNRATTTKTNKKYKKKKLNKQNNVKKYQYKP